MFKLNIECSKDIDELHINFSDGTSAVVENNSDKSDELLPTTAKSPKSNKAQPVKSPRKPLPEYFEEPTEQTDAIDNRFGDLLEDVPESSSKFQAVKRPEISLNRNSDEVSVAPEANQSF